MEDSQSGRQGSALSRRDLLKRASVVGAAVVVPGGVLAREAEAEPTVIHRDALQTLSPAEADTLDAFVGRLVPNDGVGPGAVEAGVTHYIDQSLAGALQSNQNDYALGLAALDVAAVAAYKTTFAKSTDAQKDALLTQMSANTLRGGFNGDARTFFNLVREHTLQGMFGDPHWGGNRNNIGWKLMGFPGISLDIKAQDQKTGTTSYVSQYKASAYDWDEFKRNGKAMS
jgi:gluconate 2-dehydrogenase gamma chain